MKVKGSTDGKKQEVTEGINKAGKSTAKRLSNTRQPTPKANRQSATRPKRPSA
jgi:hypothetical protein